MDKLTRADAMALLARLARERAAVVMPNGQPLKKCTTAYLAALAMAFGRFGLQRVFEEKIAVIHVRPDIGKITDAR